MKQAAGFTELRLLHFQPRDPSLLPELRWHFERSGFRVDQVGDSIDVSRPDAPGHDQGEREIAAHLLVWLLMHPDTIKQATPRGASTSRRRDEVLSDGPSCGSRAPEGSRGIGAVGATDRGVGR